MKDVIIDGADLESATATFTQNGEPAVAFAFNRKAAAIFGDITMQNIGKPFAIVLDDMVLSAPNIKEPILGGSGVISGAFTTQEANELALLLRAGALPAKITIVQQQNISATLGKEYVEMGVKAMLLGTVLVMIYMVWRYRVLGGIAIISLIVNMLCVLGFLALFQSTLTLPGIAGMILTIGMAVDGNIIIFENIRHLQEKMQKKMVFSEAFSESTSSILDANITTILACIMLYQFGFGPIRGFALTLVIGVIFSVMSSLFVTKVMIGLYFGRKKYASAL
jgi:preprotein translocase subunit SecD